jgi:spermidine synthase
MTRPSRTRHVLPEVSYSEEGDVRHLHLGTPWIQGSMQLDAPLVLVHEYVQRMMAWLLLVDPQSVGLRQAVQLGLGAGSLTKFCSKVVRMTSTAVELNPQVVLACRAYFKLPAPSARMQVLIEDAGEFVKNPDRWGTVDALQVDLYDHEAAAPVLDSPDFYAHCRRLLTEDGCMTVNLFGRSSSFERSVAHMKDAFSEPAIWSFKATREGNTVVLAQRTPTRPKRAVLLERAAIIQARYGLPAEKWVRGFKPLAP